MDMKTLQSARGLLTSTSWHLLTSFLLALVLLSGCASWHRPISAREAGRIRAEGNLWFRSTMESLRGLYDGPSRRAWNLHKAAR